MTDQQSYSEHVSAARSDSGATGPSGRRVTAEDVYYSEEVHLILAGRDQARPGVFFCPAAAAHLHELTSDPADRTMDSRLQPNPQLRYAINGGAGRSTRPNGDNTLQSLSQEEQECIRFFDDTIVSLEKSLKEEDHRRAGQARSTVVDGPQASSPHSGVAASSAMARPLSPKDQDIIDLVRPEPDLVPTKPPTFNPTSPDFQSMAATPESHFELKPRWGPMDNLPSEYNPPLPSGSYGPTDSHSSYHPPGSIPTPVLIAQKIAENQAGGTSNILPSSLRHVSLESEKPPSNSADPPFKQGPPTSSKPTRFPANISVIHSNKDHQNQSLANVHIHERRAQMLANLTGTPNPLLQEDAQQPVEQKERNTPTRSVSFRDPTPDKSRLEALSKLGLNRNRAMSGGTSIIPDSTLPSPLTGAETSAPPTTETTIKLPEANPASPPPSNIGRKTEILRTNSPRRPEERNPQTSPSPPAVTMSSYSPPPLENKASVAPPPEITSLEFNSYGGKSIVVNHSVSSRSEPVTTPTTPEPMVIPPALANPSEFNTYGGKTKVMSTAPVAVTRNDLPDILSSHMNKSQTLPAKSEPLPIEPNSYGGKSRTINPSSGFNRPSETPSKSFKPPAPTPAPRPARHSYHSPSTQQKAAQRSLSPEHKRRSGSLFRPEGITVQFSGRGASNESRKEALRKLGLLKDS
ncbi:putative proline and serine-rich protein 2 [Scophthalmus maximus]|uniref:Putative proline and serine-rich protein 2 n=1 Tax=Scophthalmus maximus TaxID=52904 RepID=A0A2U9B2X8_SCOMX|nr:putative proline and serine-rich protein 2 [Scophthalmus maximus]